MSRTLGRAEEGTGCRPEQIRKRSGTIDRLHESSCRSSIGPVGEGVVGSVRSLMVTWERRESLRCAEPYRADLLACSGCGRVFSECAMPREHEVRATLPT